MNYLPTRAGINVMNIYRIRFKLGGWVGNNAECWAVVVV